MREIGPGFPWHDLCNTHGWENEGKVTKIDTIINVFLISVFIMHFYHQFLWDFD